jgi:hypothetical protein
MPAWLPVLKMALPHLAQIATTTIPAFTRRPAPDADPVLARQINELQSAVQRNAETCRVLAEKLQQAIHDIDAAAVALEQRMARLRWIAFGSAGAAGAALLLAAWALLG